jgi:protein-S-isoprenylcysteine O-methyltransferase Ste14
MKLKGMDNLRAKLPGYPGRKIFLLPLRGLVAAIIAYSFLILMDFLPRLLPECPLLGILEPFLPVLGSLIVGGIAIRLIALVWIRRESMKAELGDLAYQKMIPKGAMGVAMIPVLILHGFTSVRSIPIWAPVTPVNGLTIQFSQSLLPLVGITGMLDIWLRLLSGGFFLLVGMIVVRRAIQTFGIDYMTVLYLYFPEESEVKEHDIYSIVRHPTYMAGVIMAGAGMFFRCSVYSIMFFFIVYLVFKIHIRREEEELIERFGEGYQEYRERTPGLYVRPKDIPSLIRFLRVKEE